MGERRIWAPKCAETGVQIPDGEMKGWGSKLQRATEIDCWVYVLYKPVMPQTDKQQYVTGLEERKSEPM